MREKSYVYIRFMRESDIDKEMFTRADWNEWYKMEKEIVEYSLRDEGYYMTQLRKDMIFDPQYLWSSWEENDFKFNEKECIKVEYKSWKYNQAYNYYLHKLEAEQRKEIKNV